MEKIFSQFSLSEAKSLSQALKEIFSFPILHIDQRKNTVITILAISKISTLFPMEELWSFLHVLRTKENSAHEYWEWSWVLAFTWPNFLA